MSKPVILTGLRANSEFHLGNYLGAILPMVELQKQHAGEYQVNMFVPDLHSFTTPIDHGKLYQQTLQNLKVFVAAGIDINNPDTYIYRQSYIPAHSELTWILNCFASFGQLRRMTQFKDKVGSKNLLEEADNAAKLYYAAAKKLEKPVDDYRQLSAIQYELSELMSKAVSTVSEIENQEGLASMGLLDYPVLMAADILLYGAKWIPVGEDQRQHIELARDVAQRMNNKFGELFTVPEDWNKQLEFANRHAGVRIRSLRNPEKKMSKSVEDPAGTIMLTDSPDEAAKKVMSATTDSVGAIHFDFDKQPGVSNLLQILALLSNKPLDDVIHEWDGKTSYGDLKKAVADAVKSFLTDFQTKLAEVNESELLSKLEIDEKAMNDVANAMLLKVQKAVGLRP
ncbi:MAG TPA: tryptophan--tRNA ligase [Candidatus Saccharimonadales bacterium]|nr:tryptophan--tRNA ligase [Candidatus Saccharimonadales bacterium]